MPYVGKKPADIIATAVDTTTGTFSGTLDVAGDLSVDNATLKVDSTNNRVGISTSSMTSKFEVAVSDNTAVQEAITIKGTQGGAYGGYLGWKDSWSGDSYTGYRGAIIADVPSANSGRLRFFTANSSTLSERMRIDNSGNLLVGQTSQAYGSVGCSMTSSGQLGGTANGDSSLILNRKTSDGTIVQFRKDNTVIGTIGTLSGYLTIGDDVGILFNNANPSISAFNASTNANRDGAIDIGVSNARFKDLYLSGGVYLGGTGSANKLDDYEEGTWTPTMGGTTTYYQRTGEYTKVGNKVFVRGQVHINAIGTGSTVKIEGLPFTSKTTSNGNPAGALNITYYSNLAIAVNFIAGHVVSAGSHIDIIANAGNNTTIQYNTGNFFGNNTRLDFSMVYQVA